MCYFNLNLPKFGVLNFDKYKAGQTNSLARLGGGQKMLPPGAVDDGSVDPGGFFTDDMLQDFPELHDAAVAQGILPGKLDGEVQEGTSAAEDEDDAFRCTLDELLGLCDDTTVACPTM